MDALTFGLTPEQFWKLSIRELWNVRRASRARIKDDLDRDVILAWEISRVEILSTTSQGGRDLPPLEKVLRRVKGQQSPTDQALVLRTIAAQYGLKLRIEKGIDATLHAPGARR